jgi:uncharacterized membrane protein
MEKKILFIVVLGLILISCISTAASYSFHSFSSISTDTIYGGMSPDGELLIGNAAGSYLWTLNNGPTKISNKTFVGIVTNSTYSGEIISNGAQSMIGNNTSTNTIVRWTPQTGVQNLHEIMGIAKPLSMSAESISANGDIVGRISNKNAQGQWVSQGFYYNQQSGTTVFFGPTAKFTSAFGVSGDGTIVTGCFEEKPFWWTQAQGMQFLAHPVIPFLQLQNDRVSQVFDVSDNGQVMVGWSGSPFECVATIWNLSGETILLSDVENNSFATSVCADGMIVVGHEFQAPNIRSAFIWDPLNGKHLLGDVLTSAGVNLGGWHLSEALAISSDGSTIMGTGINPQGQSRYWIATIPEPASLLLLGLGGMMLRRKK